MVLNLLSAIASVAENCIHLFTGITRLTTVDDVNGVRWPVNLRKALVTIGPSPANALLFPKEQILNKEELT